MRRLTGVTRSRRVLKLVVAVSAITASAFADSLVSSADAAGGARGGRGLYAGSRPGRAAIGGHATTAPGGAIRIGPAGGPARTSGHRGVGRLKGLQRFHQRSVIFVQVPGLAYPQFYHPYSVPYPYYPPYAYHPPYPPYAMPYGPGYYPGADYPVVYSQPAETYADPASDAVQVYTAPPEPVPAPPPDRLSPPEPPGDGAVRFDVSPQKAKIFIDSRYVGEARELASQPEIPLAAGRHLLEIRVGVEGTFTELVVAPDRVTVVRLAVDTREPAGAPPSPDDGLLRVTVTPIGAAIYLNGIFTAVAEGPRPVSLQLAPGRHRIQIVMPGYKSYGASITVPDQGETVLAVRLTPES
jgi:hypothetical protein